MIEALVDLVLSVYDDRVHNIFTINRIKVTVIFISFATRTGIVLQGTSHACAR